MLVGLTTLWPLPVFPTSSCAIWPFGLWVLVVQSLNRVQLYSSSTDCSLPGSSIHGVLQARILEWIAISSSRGSSWPRNWTWVFCLADEFFSTEPPGKPRFSLSWPFLSSSVTLSSFPPQGFYTFCSLPRMFLLQIFATLSWLTEGNHCV